MVPRDIMESIRFLYGFIIIFKAVLVVWLLGVRDSGSKDNLGKCRNKPYGLEYQDVVSLYHFIVPIQ
jgi:hypothetical protein